MRKTLAIGLIAAGCTGVAYAQSNVTIYGLVDLGYTYSKRSGEGSRQAIDSGNSAGSRLGFQGTEDLGNGLKAGFRYEVEIQGDYNGTNGIWSQSRASWVSLAGGFGEIRVGRQDGLGFSWLSAVSPFGTTYGQASTNTLFGYSNVGNRLDNAVFYYSPKFAGGFDAAAGYSNAMGADETAGNDGDQRAFNAGLRYRNGPLLAVLVYEQKNYQNALSSTNRDNIKSVGVGGSYDFGVVKVHAAYGQLRNRAYRSAAETEKTWLLGLSAPIGQSGSLFGTYQRNKGYNENVTTAGWNEDDAVSGVALGYTHKLSKRTNLYVYGSRYSKVVARGDDATRAGDRNQVGAGILHRF